MKLLAKLFIVLSLGLFLSGCGGDDASDPPGDDEGSTSVEDSANVDGDTAE